MISRDLFLPARRFYRSRKGEKERENRRGNFLERTRVLRIIGPIYTYLNNRARGCRYVSISKRPRFAVNFRTASRLRPPPPSIRIDRPSRDFTHLNLPFFSNPRFDPYREISFSKCIFVLYFETREKRLYNDNQFVTSLRI